MSSFWAIFWVIIKYSLIIGISLSTIALIILLFHPICFTLKGRGSVQGQRGEIKLSYLFGLFRLRYIASIHTQDVWLEFGWIKKLLQRESIKVKKENSEEEIKEDSGKTVEEEKQEATVSESVEEVEEKSVTTSESVKEEAEKDANNSEPTETEELTAKNNNETELDELDISDQTEKQQVQAEKEEKIENTSLDNNEISGEDLSNIKVVATPEQLAQLQNILEEEERKEQENKKENDLASKFRKLKKDFDKRYKQIRSKIRLIKSKWHIVIPIIKRFWNRGKKGFCFHDAFLKINYSLDDYCLTGLLYGYIAPTIGFAKRYGLNFQPAPVFPEQPKIGVYSKASWCIDIKPYKLIWAVTGLLFEKDIYKEIFPILWEKISNSIKMKFKKNKE